MYRNSPQLRLLFAGATAACVALGVGMSWAGVTVTTSGPGVGDGDILICGRPVTFNVVLSNDAGDTVTGLSHGIEISSPDGAIWEYSLLDFPAESFFDVYTIDTFSFDGAGADTVGVAATAAPNGGVPNGYPDIILTRVELSATSIGDTLCIDSAFYPPLGAWVWQTPSGDFYPSWGGPYCYITVQRGVISGNVYDDLNADGDWDFPDEPGLSGVTMHLAGAETKTTTSGPAGEYSFNYQTSGQYRVYQDVPDGMVQTGPTSLIYRCDGSTYDSYAGLDFGNIDTTVNGNDELDTCAAGTRDDFVGAEPSSPSPELLVWMEGAYNGANPYFDSACDNQGFGHTFETCWPGSGLVMEALLLMKLRATGSVTTSDRLYLGDWSQEGAAWGIYMSDLIAYATGGSDVTWNLGDEMTVGLDLANLPSAGLIGPSNALALLHDGNLDIGINDDTECDFFEMLVSVRLFDTCYGTTDANNDGLTLTAADMTYLSAFIYGCGPPPAIMYSCDLNGDGFVDPADCQLFEDYFTFGISVFDPYGGFPVPCPCDPVPVPVPDTVNIFGIQHVSAGMVCLQNISRMLSIICRGDGQVQAELPDIGVVYYSWLPDVGPEPPVGAVIEYEFVGETDGTPGQFVGAMKTEKVATDESDIWFKPLEGQYCVHGYLDGALASDDGYWQQSDVMWLRVGSLKASAKGDDDDLPAESFFDQASGITAMTFGRDDTLLWTWDAAGIYDLPVTQVVYYFDATAVDQIVYTDMTTMTSGFGTDDTVIVESESYGFVYNDVLVANLGNAVLSISEDTLLISNIGSSGEDGSIIPPLEPPLTDMGEYEFARVEIGFGDGTELPDGSSIDATASVGPGGIANTFSARQQHDEVLPGESFFDVYCKSPATGYTVDAYHDGSSVFHQEGVPAAGDWVAMGRAEDEFFPAESFFDVYVEVEVPQAREPGSATIGFTSMNSAIWNWATYGVVDQPVDSIIVTTEGYEPDTTGINELRLTATNPSRALMSLAVIDISAWPMSCCVGDRGNVDGDPDDLCNIVDLTYLVAYLFGEGDPPPCEKEADVNSDGSVNIVDLTYIVAYLFGGGPSPDPC